MYSLVSTSYCDSHTDGKINSNLYAERHRYTNANYYAHCHRAPPLSISYSDSYTQG